MVYFISYISIRSEAGYRNRFRFWRSGVRIPPGGPCWNGLCSIQKTHNPSDMEIIAKIFPQRLLAGIIFKGEKHLNHLEFGPVICTKGPYKGKIGYLDDEDICEGNQFGIVYFGNPSFCSSFHSVPITYLSNEITMYEIIQRKETLQQQILNEKDEKKKIYLLLGIRICKYPVLRETYTNTYYVSKGIKLFISYSSKDKGFKIYYTLI